MTLHFFDTSAFVKRYHSEPGSVRVQEICASVENTIVISELTIVEAASAFARRRDAGEVTSEQLDTVMNRIEDDAAREFLVSKLESETILRARDLVLGYGLRTLDALQLAAALSLVALSPVFVCSDARLIQAAESAGLTVLNPA